MGNYAFTPAGLFYPSHGGIGIYIKYGKYPNKLVLKEQSPRHLWFQCPDRELYLVANSHYGDCVYPTEGTYDEYVDLSLFNDYAASDMGVGFWMVNYVQSIGKESRTHNSRPRALGPSYSQVISDSGGYQILTGRYDFFDPKEIVRWYNKNCDIGLVLDTPTNVIRPGLYEKLAKIQKRNTEIMLDHKRPDLELMNIFHGAFAEDKKRFREICETDEIDRLAFGGAYFNSIMASIDAIVEIIVTGKSYKHYHVLGVANILQAVMLMRIASLGMANLITSDSSTSLQEALSKGYHMQPSITEPPRYMQIGNKVNIPSLPKELPCNCPACRAIRYTDVMGISGGPMWQALYYHNLYSVNRYMRSMNEIVQTTTTPELKKLLMSQFKSRRVGVEESIRTLDYIDTVADQSLDSARKKYAYYLGSMVYKTKESVLFTDTGEVQNRGDTPNMDSVETPDDDERWIRLQKIMHTHDTNSGVHGKKVKDKVKTGHKSFRSPGKTSIGKSAIKKRKKKAKPDSFKVVTSTNNGRSTSNVAQASENNTSDSAYAGNKSNHIQRKKVTA